MAEGYVKILSSILDSSIWAEPDDVVRVWVTLLAMANRDGYVGASPSGIAYRARTVSLERVKELLAKFQEPDPDSRTEDFEGRRIQKVERGYLILNYKKIRDMHGEESVKAAKRKWWAENRSTKEKQSSGQDSDVEKLESSRSSVSSEISSHGSANGSGSSFSVSEHPAKKFESSFADPTKAPDSIEFDAWSVEFCDRHKINIKEEWESCRDYRKSRGETREDWSAEFRSWLKKARDFKPKTEDAKPSKRGIDAKSAGLPGY